MERLVLKILQPIESQVRGRWFGWKRAGRLAAGWRERERLYEGRGGKGGLEGEGSVRWHSMGKGISLIHYFY